MMRPCLIAREIIAYRISFVNNFFFAFRTNREIFRISQTAVQRARRSADKRSKKPCLHQLAEHALAAGLRDADAARPVAQRLVGADIDLRIVRRVTGVKAVLGLLKEHLLHRADEGAVERILQLCRHRGRARGARLLHRLRHLIRHFGGANRGKYVPSSGRICG